VISSGKLLRLVLMYTIMVTITFPFADKSKIMPRRSKIAPHASMIHRLLREGESVLAIHKQLEDLQVSVSYEGLRKWVHANPVEGVVLNGPGRPRSGDTSPFDFLPENLSEISAAKPPAFLLPFAALYAEPESIRLEVTKRAMWQLGLPYHDLVPRTEWILPADRLARCSDLEYCIVAYMVSNLPPPPLDGITLHYEEWLAKLMSGATRLKAATKEGLDICGADLFYDSKI